MKINIRTVLLLLLFQIISETNAQEVYGLWEGEEIPYHKKNNLQEYEKEAWGHHVRF